MRVGLGYDVHRLVAGRKLILGGVEIPYELGLDGHSDADVLLHAMMDALLGAAALGDIGKLFPDTDEAYRGADSADLCRAVKAQLDQKGYGIENLDCVVIAQRPKLASYMDAIRASIGAIFGLTLDQVSVKATTTEGLGFEGRGEGIGCQAVCLIKKT